VCRTQWPAVSWTAVCALARGHCGGPAGACLGACLRPAGLPRGSGGLPGLGARGSGLPACRPAWPPAGACRPAAGGSHARYYLRFAGGPAHRTLRQWPTVARSAQISIYLTLIVGVYGGTNALLCPHCRRTALYLPVLPYYVHAVGCSEVCVP
jgi:hypothetical protein